MCQIWFVRHGESEANAGFSSKDPASIPLTPIGEKQAKEISSIWPKPPSQIIYSPYSRALATAQPTIQRFPSVACEEWAIQEFTYLSPSKCSDTTSMQRLPWVEEYWDRNDPNYTDGEGAESFSNLLKRVSHALSSFSALSSNEFCAVFTHGMYMSAVLFSVLTGFSKPTPQSMALFRLFIQTTPVPNGAILKCTINEQGEIFISDLYIAHLAGCRG